MIMNLVIFAIIALILYLIFSGSDWDDYHTKRYDDKVIEAVGGRFMLVDKDSKRWS